MDARGSVVAGSDFGAGGVAEEAAYGPWGVVLDVGLTTVTPEHTFLGSEADSGTGWHRFGPRAYDPTLRRWTSADPLALAAPSSVGRGDLGVFSYAANNPTTFTDKTGLVADRPTPGEFNPEAVEAAAMIPVLARGVVVIGTQSLRENPIPTVVTVTVGIVVSVVATPAAGALAATAVSSGFAGFKVGRAVGENRVGLMSGEGDAFVEVGKAVLEAGVEVAVGKVGGRRAGQNGVQGPIKQISRTNRQGTKSIKQTFPDGSTKDISRRRVKESVPNTHPKAPRGTPLKVKFDNAQAGSKGVMRDPTPAEVKELE